MKCKYDLSEDCHNNDCLACMLDKIRAEIENRINNCDDNNFKDGLCEALDIVYFKIKELSE